ncbi:MAG: pyridoxamine 5'-phosphate oxidase family protein [Campylobacterales bacterium]|nr:pyridoxamine 5'-phosphate oxidase family protein [Campylobacterales bacterium]
MSEKLKKISSFLNEHHVMSLATATAEEISVCSLFYAFDEQKLSFVVASSEDAKHIKHIVENSNIAGNILLETKIIGKIQGVQFRGNFVPLEDKELKIEYFKAFPYALALNPKLWQIKVNYFKMTDNRLGFGEKIIWDAFV